MGWLRRKVGPDPGSSQEEETFPKIRGPYGGGGVRRDAEQSHRAMLAATATRRIALGDIAGPVSKLIVRQPLRPTAETTPTPAKRTCPTTETDRADDKHLIVARRHAQPV